MQSKLLIMTLLTAGMIFACLYCSAGNDPQPQDESLSQKMAAILRVADFDGCAAAADQLVKKRRRLIERLILIAATNTGTTTRPFKSRDRSDGMARLLAIDLLGEYRAIEAIPVLVENIEFIPPTTILVEEDLVLCLYPCVRALSTIGPSAMRGIFMHLQYVPPSSVSDKAIHLYAKTMESIYAANIDGHKELIAVVERATERAREKENMQRLLKALNVNK